jgi:hypothetical protein
VPSDEGAERGHGVITVERLPVGSINR